MPATLLLLLLLLSCVFCVLSISCYIPCTLRIQSAHITVPPEIAYSTLKRHVYFLYHIPKTTASRHQKLDFPWELSGYPDCLFPLQHSFMLLVRGLV